MKQVCEESFGLYIHLNKRSIICQLYGNGNKGFCKAKQSEVRLKSVNLKSRVLGSHTAMKE